MDITSLINSFTADGTLDSEGRFTVGLSQARRKLRSFRGTDNSRYLVLLVSSGIASGATSVTISYKRNQLQVSMPGAYFQEAELMGAFEQMFAKGLRPATTDLLLGLQMALAEGAVSCEIVCQDETAPFQWTLSEEAEESLEAPDGPRQMTATIRFQKRKGGAKLFAKSDEAQWVTRVCHQATVPIELLGKSVNRPLTLASAPVCLSRGTHIETVCKSPVTIFDQQWGIWKGALSLRPGSVSIVVQGVLFQGSTELDLDGVVYCDDIRLDLSRENVVQNKTYEKLLRSLRKARTDMLVWADLDQVGRDWPVEMAEHLIEPALQGRLCQARMKTLVGWLDSVPRFQERSKRESELKFVYRMAKLYHQVNDSERFQETAAKAYDQAQLQFENEGLDPTLVDMCAWLSEHLALRSAAAAWRVLGASLALGRRRRDTRKRLKALLRTTLRPDRVAYLRMGLATYLDSIGQEEAAAHQKAEVRSILRRLGDSPDKRTLADLFEEDALLGCNLIAHRLRHFASHTRAIARAIAAAARK